MPKDGRSPVIDTRKKVSIGIDPGSKGALAWITEDRRDIGLLKFTPDRPQTLARTVDKLASLSYDYRIAKTALERVGAMPAQGVSSMFAFGRNYGNVEGILYAVDIPFELVTPQVWQRMMSLGGHQENRKKAHADKARKLFPQLTKEITQESGDGLLIAEYAWRRAFL